VIVPEGELELIVGKRKRRAMWRPVTRGSQGERQPCPFEVGQCVPLQPKPGVRGTKITVTSFSLTTLGMMTDSDATQQGYLGGIRGARAAWEAVYGSWRDDREAWAILFNLGDHSAFYRDHAERFLNRKLGAARDYTYDPAKAVRGEGAVPSADLAPMAARAERQREEAAEKALRQTLRTIEASIRDMEPHESSLDKQTKKDLRWMRRRAAQIRKGQGEPFVAADLVA
jgi:hypothetical protein